MLKKVEAKKKKIKSHVYIMCWCVCVCVYNLDGIRIIITIGRTMRVCVLSWVFAWVCTGVNAPLVNKTIYYCIMCRRIVRTVVKIICTSNSKTEKKKKSPKIQTWTEIIGILDPTDRMIGYWRYYKSAVVFFFFY